MQPGVSIDYATGDSSLAKGEAAETTAETAAGQTTEASYVPNTNTKKFHDPSRSSIAKMKESSKQSFTGTRQELIDKGYAPCGKCNP